MSSYTNVDIYITISNLIFREIINKYYNEKGQAFDPSDKRYAWLKEKYDKISDFENRSFQTLDYFFSKNISDDRFSIYNGLYMYFLYKYGHILNERKTIINMYRRYIPNEIKLREKTKYIVPLKIIPHIDAVFESPILKNPGISYDGSEYKYIANFKIHVQLIDRLLKRNKTNSLESVLKLYVKHMEYVKTTNILIWLLIYYIYYDSNDEEKSRIIKFDADRLLKATTIDEIHESYNSKNKTYSENIPIYKHLFIILDADTKKKKFTTTDSRISFKYDYNPLKADVVDFELILDILGMNDQSEFDQNLLDEFIATFTRWFASNIKEYDFLNNYIFSIEMQAVLFYSWFLASTGKKNNPYAFVFELARTKDYSEFKMRYYSYVFGLERDKDFMAKYFPIVSKELSKASPDPDHITAAELRKHVDEEVFAMNPFKEDASPEIFYNEFGVYVNSLIVKHTTVNSKYYTVLSYRQIEDRFYLQSPFITALQKMSIGYTSGTVFREILYSERPVSMRDNVIKLLEFYALIQLSRDLDRSLLYKTLIDKVPALINDYYGGKNNMETIADYIVGLVTPAAPVAPPVSSSSVVNLELDAYNEIFKMQPNAGVVYIYGDECKYYSDSYKDGIPIPNGKNLINLLGFILQNDTISALFIVADNKYIVGAEAFKSFVYTAMFEMTGAFISQINTIYTTFELTKSPALKYIDFTKSSTIRVDDASEFMFKIKLKTDDSVIYKREQLEALMEYNNIDYDPLTKENSIAAIISQFEKQINKQRQRKILIYISIGSDKYNDRVRKQIEQQAAIFIVKDQSKQDELGRLQEENDNLKNRLDELRPQLEKSKQRVVELEENEGKNKAEISTLNKKNSDIMTQIKEKEGKILENDKKISELRGELDTARTQLTENNRILGELKSDVITKQGQIEQAKIDLENAKDELKRFGEAAANAEAEYKAQFAAEKADFDRRILYSLDEKEKAEKALTEATAAKETAEQNVRELAGKRDSLQEQLYNLTEKYKYEQAKLKEEIENLKTSNEELQQVKQAAIQAKTAAEAAVAAAKTAAEAAVAAAIRERDAAEALIDAESRKVIAANAKAEEAAALGLEQEEKARIQMEEAEKLKAVAAAELKRAKESEQEAKNTASDLKRQLEELLKNKGASDSSVIQNLEDRLKTVEQNAATAKARAEQAERDAEAANINANNMQGELDRIKAASKEEIDNATRSAETAKQNEVDASIREKNALEQLRKAEDRVIQLEQMGSGAAVVNVKSPSPHMMEYLYRFYHHGNSDVYCRMISRILYVMYKHLDDDLLQKLKSVSISSVPEKREFLLDYIEYARKAVSGCQDGILMYENGVQPIDVQSFSPGEYNERADLMNHITLPDNKEDILSYALAVYSGAPLSVIKSYDRSEQEEENEAGLETDTGTIDAIKSKPVSLIRAGIFVKLYIRYNHM